MTAKANKQPTDLPQKFGRCIRKLRLERGIASQEELADLAGLHRTFVGRVERGETNLTLQNIKKLADALNVSLSELFQHLESE